MQMVTLEATSDYWRIFYYLLEALGLAVQLVGSGAGPAAQGPPEDRPVKHDAMWLARLTEWGMLRPCFVPPARSGRCGTTPAPHPRPTCASGPAATSGWRSCSKAP